MDPGNPGCLLPDYFRPLYSMKQVLFNQGKVSIIDVPVPSLQAGNVLVKVHYSLISTGTELSNLLVSGQPIWKKALTQPEKVQKAIKMVKAGGVAEAVAKTKAVDQESSEVYPGYSCSGIVVECARDIEYLSSGVKVACAGAGIASHAEFVSVPRNLAVRVPDNLGMKEAASVAVGSIALQGVRRAGVQLGETVAVIGLGLLGQLTAQLLKNAGCRVIGFDQKKSRAVLAETLGIDHSFDINEIDPVSEALRLTSGRGVDITIICAATRSHLPLQQAMEMTRKKGKVVVVGEVGMHLRRKPFYEKEIDLLISCSYGPGRYDPGYELCGRDYPFAYVRWTEQRNMEEYLRLISEGRIQYSPLITGEYPLHEAARAYQELADEGKENLANLLVYPSAKEALPAAIPTGEEHRIQFREPGLKKTGSIRVAVIGAGSFARAVHLPNIKKLPQQISLKAIADISGVSSSQAARQFGAEYCTTDYRQVLADSEVEMVIIATRHNLHASLAIEALQAGKAVLLEKPMAVNRGELEELVEVIRESRLPFMIGFNRRFSPCAVRAREVLSSTDSPRMINYRVNAGFLPPDHWTHSREGGGRIIGEACHMFDLFNFFVDSEVQEIKVLGAGRGDGGLSPSDNFTAQLKYGDGSICSLMYTALGDGSWGKEYLEIYCGGKVLVIDDFKELIIRGDRRKGIKSRKIQKGHLEELKEFSLAVGGRKEEPITPAQLIAATEISFTVDELCGAGFSG